MDIAHKCTVWRVFYLCADVIGRFSILIHQLNQIVVLFLKGTLVFTYVNVRQVVVLFDEGPECITSHGVGLNDILSVDIQQRNLCFTVCSWENPLGMQNLHRNCFDEYGLCTAAMFVPDSQKAAETDTIDPVHGIDICR